MRDVYGEHFSVRLLLAGSGELLVIGWLVGGGCIISLGARQRRPQIKRQQE